MHRVKALQHGDRAALFALVGLPEAAPAPAPEPAAAAASSLERSTASEAEGAAARPRSPVIEVQHEACHIEGEDDDEGFEIIDFSQPA